jgi:hypothetical protein
MKNGVFWDVTPCGSCIQEPHGVTSQNSGISYNIKIFIITVVRTSDLIWMIEGV